MRIICTILVLLISEAYGFSGRKCDAFMKREGFFGLPTFLTTSTGQFLSSSGECSAVGKTPEQERQLFYAVNWKFIQNDVAKGYGENLTALLRLSGCKGSKNSPAQKMLKNDYENIFDKDVEGSYLYISPILDNYCKKSEG